MATRYTIDDLLHLRQSPLCTKPASLPPAEEWMGQQPAESRAQPETNDTRSRPLDNILLEQSTRRVGLDRARTSANPEDIILGPPRTSFLSSSMRSTSHKLGDNDTAPDNDLRERFNFRSRATDGSTDDRGDRLRDGRSGTYRSRRDIEQESEGWTAVKPRKSFGNEGAERFQRGSMGDRFGNRDDTRRQRDRDDPEVPRDRTRHHVLSRDKDGDDQDQPRRNGLNRNRTEPWFVKDHNAGNDRNTEDRPSQRERIDRAKSWRDKNDSTEEPRPEFRPRERNNDRTNNRGWDRDNRGGRDSYKGAEHDPEWMDEPAGEKAGARTEMDLKKFLENMKKANGPKNDDQPATAAADGPPMSSFFELGTKTKAPDSAPAVDPAAPDRFFETFGPATSKVAEGAKNSKSSRFASYFNSQEERRQTTEPPTPAAAAPAAAAAPPPVLPPQNGLGALFAQVQAQAQGQPSSDTPQQEKEAFQVLLQKLQKQTLQSSGTPPSAGPSQPPPAQQEDSRKSNVVSPDAYQQYGRAQGDEAAQFRGVPQSMLDSMISQRSASNAPSQPPSTRPEQMLQHLVGHRQQAPSQGSNRMESTPAPASNPQTEFLMGLMRGHQNAPEPRRTEEMMAVRMPQPQKQVSLPSVRDREIELEMRERERYQQQQQAQHMQQLQQQQQQASQQQHAMQLQLQQQGPQQQGQSQQQQQQQQHMRANQQRAPNMAFEEQFRRPEQESRPPQQQPTAILQRPPPGLDHQMHPGFMNPGPNPQLPPPQRGPMIPPPGLMNQSNRPMPGMFPPPGAFAPPGVFPGPGPGPDGMGGPPRSMQPPPPPPPGFFNGPPPPGPPGPPGFMPPMPGMGFPPPDGVGFPFDARGMPPPGAQFRRP